MRTKQWLKLFYLQNNRAIFSWLEVRKDAVFNSKVVPRQDRKYSCMFLSFEIASPFSLSLSLSSSLTLFLPMPRCHRSIFPFEVALTKRIHVKWHASHAAFEQHLRCLKKKKKVPSSCVFIRGFFIVTHKPEKVRLEHLTCKNFVALLALESTTFSLLL